jgi:hypothetical protein
MEASQTTLYRALGRPLSEQYDIGYRRIKWPCGCTAAGRTSENMLVKRCLLHHHVPLERNIGLRR